MCVQRTSKRCWYWGPDQCTGISGQQSTNKKSWKREHGSNQLWHFCERKRKGIWTEKHRDVARKIFLAGGWKHKRLFDIGWSDVSQCQACQMEEGTEKHRLYHCAGWHEIRWEIRSPSESGSKRWKPRRKSGSGKEVSSRTLSVKANGTEASSVWQKWESEKHKSWSIPAEGFKGHVATDGSVLGKAGKWWACGWAVVQLDYDEEMGLLHGMYGSIEAEYEVQRTIKRTDLTAFLFLSTEWLGQPGSMSTTKELSMDYEEERVSEKNQEREMLACG